MTTNAKTIDAHWSDPDDAPMLTQAWFDGADVYQGSLWGPNRDAAVIDQLVALGESGMASGVDDVFDIDVFVEASQAQA